MEEAEDTVSAQKPLGGEFELSDGGRRQHRLWQLLAAFKPFELGEEGIARPQPDQNPRGESHQNVPSVPLEIAENSRA